MLDEGTRLASIRTATIVAAAGYGFVHEAYVHAFAGLVFLVLAVFFLRAQQP